MVSHDAANIGWKLGWVLNGLAGEELLGSYTPERRAATLDVFANATKSARFMTPSTYGWKLMRDAALSLAITHPFAGALANPRQMTAFSYLNSPAVIAEDAAFTAGPVVGSVLPEMQLDEGFLSEYLGLGFTALCFDTTLAAEIAAAVGDDHTDNTLRTLTLPLAIADRFCAQTSSVYLIRPDLHIAARWHNATAQVVVDGFHSVTFRNRKTI